MEFLGEPEGAWPTKDMVQGMEWLLRAFAPELGGGMTLEQVSSDDGPYVLGMLQASS